MVSKPDTAHHYQAVLASIAPSDDIVEYAMRCVQALSPNIQDDVVNTTKRHLKEVFGGQRIYVNQKRSGYENRTLRDEAIRRDHRRGDHVHLLTRRYSLSRATIHRILSTTEPPSNA